MIPLRGQTHDAIELAQRAQRLAPEQLRALGLCYFRYSATAKGRDAAAAGAQFPDDFEALIASGHVTAHPITYEDFLPVSAAGIFRSNLADQPRETYEAADSRDAFIAALGHEPRDPFALYEQEQAASVAETRARLGITAR